MQKLINQNIEREKKIIRECVFVEKRKKKKWEWEYVSKENKIKFVT